MVLSDSYAANYSIPAIPRMAISDIMTVSLVSATSPRRETEHACPDLVDHDALHGPAPATGR